MVAAVAEEYTREAERARTHDAEARRAARVKALLAGERVDSGALGYPLDDWHIAMVADGPVAPPAVRGLAAALDRRLLVVGTGDEAYWYWLGGRRRVGATELLQAAAEWTTAIAIGVGELAVGVEGWRLSHRQAKAAMSVARRRGSTTRYSDVALLTSCLQDEVLTATLRDLYLEPLRAERDGGQTLKRTLLAYLAAERNISSAAAALGVSRKTVNNRLRTVEQLLDRPLSQCAAEVEAALRMDDFEHQTGASEGSHTG